MHLNHRQKMIETHLNGSFGLLIKCLLIYSKLYFIRVRFFSREHRRRKYFSPETSPQISLVFIFQIINHFIAKINRR